MEEKIDWQNLLKDVGEIITCMLPLKDKSALKQTNHFFETMVYNDEFIKLCKLLNKELNIYFVFNSQYLFYYDRPVLSKDAKLTLESLVQAIKEILLTKRISTGSYVIKGLVLNHRERLQNITAQINRDHPIGNFLLAVLSYHYIRQMHTPEQEEVRAWKGYYLNDNDQILNQIFIGKFAPGKDDVPKLFDKLQLNGHDTSFYTALMIYNPSIQLAFAINYKKTAEVLSILKALSLQGSDWDWTEAIYRLAFTSVYHLIFSQDGLEDFKTLFASLKSRSKDEILDYVFPVSYALLTNFTDQKSKDSYLHSLYQAEDKQLFVKTAYSNTVSKTLALNPENNLPILKRPMDNQADEERGGPKRGMNRK